MQKTIFSKHNEQLCSRLIELRKAAGLTQRQLGKILKKDHTFVTKSEGGQRRVDMVEFYWICLALGASPEKETAKLVKAFRRLGKERKRK